MKKYTMEFIIDAHKDSSSHKSRILESDFCGCSYCKKVYKSSEVKDWIDEPCGGETAICPKCGIDSVLSSDLPIKEKEFLLAMHNHWFSEL